MKGIVPIDPFMPVQIKFFGRYKGGAIRDGVLLCRFRGKSPATPG
jgi:hypothetical protein